jgi:hypothetical protein
MQSLIRLTTLLSNLFRKRRADRDLDEEVRSYATFLAEEKIAAGLSPDEARRKARLKLGASSKSKNKFARSAPVPGSILCFKTSATPCAAINAKHSHC